MFITELPTKTKITDKLGMKISIGADFLGAVILKFPWNSSGTRVIPAKGGHRIELRE